LARLEASARVDHSTSKGDNPDNLLQLAVEAAQARCTLGEISMALEKVWGRHVPQTSVVQGAYSSSWKEGSSNANDECSFEIVLERVKEFEKKEGRRPRSKY
jgi:methylmalonyl-CoA mutase